MERTLSLKPVQRVWFLRTICGSNSPSRIARRCDFNLAEVANQRLLGDSVPAVTALGASRIVLRIARMLSHLTLHGSLDHSLGELRNQALYDLCSPTAL